MTVDRMLMGCQALHAKVNCLEECYFHLLLGVELTRKRNASELE